MAAEGGVGADQAILHAWLAFPSGVIPVVPIDASIRAFRTIQVSSRLALDTVAADAHTAIYAIVGLTGLYATIVSHIGVVGVAWRTLQHAGHGVIVGVWDQPIRWRAGQAGVDGCALGARPATPAVPVTEQRIFEGPNRTCTHALRLVEHIGYVTLGAAGHRVAFRAHLQARHTCTIAFLLVVSDGAHARALILQQVEAADTRQASSGTAARQALSRAWGAGVQGSAGGHPIGPGGALQVAHIIKVYGGLRYTGIAIRG